MVPQVISLWRRYWEVSGDPKALALFRRLWTQSHVYLSMRVLYFTVRERELPAVPYYDALAIFSLIPWQVEILLTCCYAACAIAVFLGWHTRQMQILLAILSLPLLLRSASLYANHVAFIAAGTFALAFAPTDRYYAADALRRKRDDPRTFDGWQATPVSYFAQRLLLVQTSFLYLFAGMSKWTTGWVDRISVTYEMPHLIQSLGGMGSELWAMHLGSPFLFFIAASVPLLMIFLSLGIHYAARFPLIAILGIEFHLILLLLFPIYEVVEFTTIMSMMWLIAMEKTKPWVERNRKSHV